MEHLCLAHGRATQAYSIRLQSPTTMHRRQKELIQNHPPSTGKATAATSGIGFSPTPADAKAIVSALLGKKKLGDPPPPEALVGRQEMRKHGKYTSGFLRCTFYKSLFSWRLWDDIVMPDI